MTQTLTFVQLNDIHGYLEAHPELFYTDQGLDFRTVGGYARIKYLLDQWRQEESLIVLDNGDTFHGTYEVVQSQGRLLLPVLNQLGLDAMTFHWDTAYGPNHLLELGEELNYPILAGNVYDEATDDLLFSPYELLEVDGVTIGLIGLACHIVDKTMPPKFSQGAYFTLGDEELPGYIAAVRDQGADLVVLLSHLGFPQDCQLVSKVPGVDLVISGHTHNRLDQPVQVKDTLLIQSGCHGSFIGKIQVDLDPKIPGIQAWRHELLPLTQDIPEDSALKEEIQDLLAPDRDYLEEVVGSTQVPLHRGYNLETPMDNFLLEALLHATGADLAFSNGWRYGAPILPGPITRRELYQMVPMDPPISQVQLTGQEIWDMLEENLENTYAHDPFHQMGGYLKRSLGLQAYFKVENPKGTRLQRLFIQGQPIDLERTYDVAYLTQQGVPRKYGQHHKDLDLHVIQALENYLQATRPYQGRLGQTFRLI